MNVTCLFFWKNLQSECSVIFFVCAKLTILGVFLKKKLTMLGECNLCHAREWLPNLVMCKEDCRAMSCARMVAESCHAQEGSLSPVTHEKVCQAMSCVRRHADLSGVKHQMVVFGRICFVTFCITCLRHYGC